MNNDIKKGLGLLGKGIAENLKNVQINKEDLTKSAKNVSEKAKEFGSKSGEVVKSVGDKVTVGAKKAKDSTVNALDVNGDGSVDIEDIIILAMKTPGIKIDREKFLRKELNSKYEADVIDYAVKKNLTQAGITIDVIDKLADDTINNERLAVSGISTALGTPGGATMIATIPTDIVQYYGYTLRAVQKLMYLYGYPEINLDENELNIDSQTMNTIILMIGTMYGVGSAANAVKVMAKMLGNGVQKELMKKALTKGVFYPIVKEISKWFGVRMTKSMFTGFFNKAIPLVGGVISGGMTYLSFKPCCDKLQLVLRDTVYTNPNRQQSQEELELYESFMNNDIIDI